MDEEEALDVEVEDILLLVKEGPTSAKLLTSRRVFDLWKQLRASYDITAGLEALSSTPELRFGSDSMISSMCLESLRNKENMFIIPKYKQCLICDVKILNLTITQIFHHLDEEMTLQMQ